MGLSIEKVEGGYIVSHHNVRSVATAEHVANFIMTYWPDVMAHIRPHVPSPEPISDEIVNQ